MEPIEHVLVPIHEKLTDEEREAFLKEYGITSLAELPKIRKDDPAIRHLQVKRGDIIRIRRKSPTAGETIFYRVVVNA